jgi:hypothetical protein
MVSIVIVKVLECNKPTSKGYIYPKETVEYAIQEYLLHSDCFGGFLDNFSDNFSLFDAAFIVNNLYFENNDLLANIEILKTSNGDSLKSILNKDSSLVKFTIAGRGKTKNKTIFDYKLLSVVVELIKK